MNDVHAYRASDELAAALRAFRETEREFGEQITAWDTAHPGHELLWVADSFSAGKRAVGFTDGQDEVPSGLSRAKTRTELRPKKTKAGKPWQDTLDWANKRPSVEPVYSRFGIPAATDGGARGGNSLSRYIMSTQWGDAGDDGVLVYTRGDLRHPFFGSDKPAEISEHLTPIPLSEFYAIKERLDVERAPAA